MENIESFRERRRLANRKYEARFPEKVKAKKRAWFDANPEYMRAYYLKTRKAAMLNACKMRAKRDNVPCNIVLDDIVIPDVCPVLGIPIEHNANKGFHPNSPSVDRIIPSLGYIRGNVRVISVRANLLKRDGTPEELERVAQYLRGETLRVCAELSG